jgi:thiol-disulfide isomerase/thioredoxin
MAFLNARSLYINLGLILALVVLYFTGGFTWLQAQLLGRLAGQPRVEQDALFSLSDQDWAWNLRTLDGQFVSLKEFQGKPLVVNRWATWCGPCQAEMPSLQALHERYGEGIAMVLVSEEDPETLRDWLERKGYTMPVYRSTGPAPEAFKSRSIPITWLIDPQGRVLSKHTGAARWDGDKVSAAIDAMGS